MWARSCENVSYAICEQQRCRSACASAQSNQHLCCSLLRQYDMYTCYIPCCKILASLCSLADWFESYLVANSRRHVFAWCGSWHSFCSFITSSLKGSVARCKVSGNVLTSWWTSACIFTRHWCLSPNLFEPRHEKMCLQESPTRPDTNRPAQPQKLARVLKFQL